MGYSPLRAGFAFLPFSVGIVIGAGWPPTWSAGSTRASSPGVGTLLAALALFGFSRLTVPEDGASLLATLPTSMGGQGLALGADVSYWTDDPAVHRADVVRHGADVRAADPDRRAPRCAARTPASAPAC